MEVEPAVAGLQEEEDGSSPSESSQLEALELDEEGACVEAATPAAAGTDGDTTQQTQQQQQQQHEEQRQEQQAEAPPQPQPQPAAAEVETLDDVRTCAHLIPNPASSPLTQTAHCTCLVLPHFLKFSGGKLAVGPNHASATEHRVTPKQVKM